MGGEGVLWHMGGEGVTVASFVGKIGGLTGAISAC
jgi:hypothetical protein